MYNRAHQALKPAVRRLPPSFTLQQEQGQQKPNLNYVDDRRQQNDGNWNTRPFQHRLMDPGQELRKIRHNLNNLLYEEYIETKKLDVVLAWANQIRQNGVNESPLMDLIGKLHRERNEPLKLPLYYAFLRSPESKLYLERPELLFPAINDAFESDPAQQLGRIETIYNQIKQSLSKYNSPDRIAEFNRLLRTKFRRYILVENASKFYDLNQFVAMAKVLRQSGVYPNPLMDLVEVEIGLDWRRVMGKRRRVLRAYKEFMAEEQERNMYSDRTHIHFPWLLNQLRDKQHQLAATMQLIRLQSEKPKEVPQFIINELHNVLGPAFRQACANNAFQEAVQIWQFSTHVPQFINYNIAFPPFDPLSMLVLAFHLWTTKGDKLHARKILHVFHKTHPKMDINGENSKSFPMKKVLLALLNLDICYRQIVNGTLSLSKQSREHCRQIFINALDGLLLTNDKPFALVNHVQKHIGQMLKVLYDDPELVEGNNEDDDDDQGMTMARLDRISEVLNSLKGVQADARQTFLDRLGEESKDADKSEEKPLREMKG